MQSPTEIEIAETCTGFEHASFIVYKAPLLMYHWSEHFNCEIKSSFWVPLGTVSFFFFTFVKRKKRKTNRYGHLSIIISWMNEKERMGMSWGTESHIAILLYAQ
jgi:hypothetical protein